MTTTDDMEEVNNQLRIVNQLRAEVNIKRIKVSMACKDLIQYCQEHIGGDAMVSGFKESLNPYDYRNIALFCKNKNTMESKRL